MPTAWTPANGASSPLLYDTPTHSLRVYFYDLTTRAEITIPPYHELSGMIWTPPPTPPRSPLPLPSTPSP